MGKKYDNEKFAAVWSRVMPETAGTADIPPAAGDMAALLCSLINSKALNLKYYTVLARRYQGKSPGKIFSSLARDEAAHLRKLQTAHYILTGDSCVPHMEPVRITSVLAALRTCYLSEREGEKTFTMASLQDDEPKRTQLFAHIAADEARHALLLEELIENTL